MADTIIGRAAEQEILRQRIDSGNSELIAIYGRRRVGKTFLVHLVFISQVSIKVQERNSSVNLTVSWNFIRDTNGKSQRIGSMRLPSCVNILNRWEAINLLLFFLMNFRGWIHRKAVS